MVTKESRERSSQIERDLREGIGASEIAALLGLNPYSSPLHVYKIKKGILKFNGNKFTTAGHMLEGSLVKWACDQEEMTLHEEEPLMIHARKPYLRCHPDAICEDADGMLILECKTTQKSIEDVSDLPASWMYQVQYQMGISLIHRAKIAVLTRGIDFQVFDIPFSETMFELCEDAADDFWNKHYLIDVPPPYSTGKDVEEAIKRSTENKAVDCTPWVEETVTELALIKEKIKTLKAQESELADKVKAYMIDAEFLTNELGEKLATWKSQNPRELIDKKRLKEEYPEVYEAVKKYSAPIRPLRILI